MPRDVTVALDWEIYNSPEDVPQRAGIYMVLAGSRTSSGEWNLDSYELLDIGQSGESGVRLDRHDRRDCWMNEKSSDKTILYKFAPMLSEDHDRTDRLIVECCLRANTRPPCGTECNDGYDREDSVSITNNGKRAPLRETYSCP